MKVLALLLLALTAGGCAFFNESSLATELGRDVSFRRILREFDSLSNRVSEGSEPQQLDYIDSPERLHGLVRHTEGTGLDMILTQVLKLEAQTYKEENPSGRARSYIDDMLAMVGSDLSRAARVVGRLLWVLEEDPSLLNQVKALHGLEIVMTQLQLAILQPGIYSVVTSAERQAEVKRAEDILGRLAPGFRSQPQLSSEEEQEYSAALVSIAAHALPSSYQRRQLVLVLETLWEEESDPELKETAKEALQRSLHAAIGYGMLAVLQTPSSHDHLRDSAIRSYRRLAGVAGVPFVLKVVSKDEVHGPLVALTLVRLCSQLSQADAEKTFLDGPSALSFLYTTAFDSRVGDDLQLVALEGLARCLHHENAIPDPEWARQWWRQRALQNPQ